MTDRATITTAFQRHEDEAGGYAAAGGDAMSICRRVAAELDIPLEDVLAVMREEIAGGAG